MLCIVGCLVFGSIDKGSLEFTFFNFVVEMIEFVGRQKVVNDINVGSLMNTL